MSKQISIFGTTYNMSGTGKGIKYVNASNQTFALQRLIISSNAIDLRYYTLQIEYRNILTDAHVAQTHTESIISGCDYTVRSPSISGMSTDQTVVSGIMTGNRTVIVYYRPSVEQRGDTLYIYGAVAYAHNDSLIIE